MINANLLKTVPETEDENCLSESVYLNNIFIGTRKKSAPDKEWIIDVKIDHSSPEYIAGNFVPKKFGE